MISEFTLLDLRCTTAAKCATDTGVIFHASIRMPEDRQQALWDYGKGQIDNNDVAVIQHDNCREDGTPINPIMIEFKHQ